MTSRVNLVVVLLTLSCLATALTRSDQSRRFTEEIFIEKVHKNTLPLSNAHSSNTEGIQETVGKVRPDSNTDPAEELSVQEMEIRESSQARKKKLDHTMMALLMAYKMKFVALIPTMLGGLALLKGTALLAGFFFALFAAVLGLKVH